METNRPWGIHTIRDMVGPDDCSTNIGSYWVRSVPSPYYGRRILKAWWVLTGRAEAVIWPQPGDLEVALGAQWPKPKHTT